MPKLSPEQKQQVIQNLTALPSMRDTDDRCAFDIVSAVCNCSTAEAQEILDDLKDQGLRQDSDSGGQPGDKPMDEYGWRWVWSPDQAD